MIGNLPDVRMGFVRNKIIINFFLKKRTFCIIISR